MVQGSHLCRSPAHFPGRPRVLISLGGISGPFPQPHTVTQTLYFPGLRGLGWALRPYTPMLMGPPCLGPWCPAPRAWGRRERCRGADEARLRGALSGCVGDRTQCGHYALTLCVPYRARMVQIVYYAMPMQISLL